jgi:hypothetical protein
MYRREREREQVLEAPFASFYCWQGGCGEIALYYRRWNLLLRAGNEGEAESWSIERERDELIVVLSCLQDGVVVGARF